MSPFEAYFHRKSRNITNLAQQDTPEPNLVEDIGDVQILESSTVSDILTNQASADVINKKVHKQDMLTSDQMISRYILKTIKQVFHIL